MTDENEWTGTKKDLQKWIRYKQQKATAFLKEGYSVGWHPNHNGWIHIYTPSPGYVGIPALSAVVDLDRFPVEASINGGRIWELHIIKKAYSKRRQWLYQFSLGDCDTNKLRKSQEAKRLYDIVIKELN